MLIPIKLGTTDILYEPDLTAWLSWFNNTNIRAYTNLDGVTFGDLKAFLYAKVAQQAVELDGKCQTVYDLPVIVYN